MVAFRASGVSEAVDSGKTGFLVEAGREEEMALAALNLLSDESLRSDFSGAAREWSERFSLGRMGEQLLEAYERAVEIARNGEK